MNAIQDVLSDEQWESFREPVAIELKKGACSFHHPLLVHGSFENHSNRPRRAIVINAIKNGICSDSDKPLLNGTNPIPKGHTTWRKISSAFYQLTLVPTEKSIRDEKGERNRSRT